MVEHRLPKPRIAGSNPVARSIYYLLYNQTGINACFFVIHQVNINSLAICRPAIIACLWRNPFIIGLVSPKHIGHNECKADSNG